MTGWIAWWKKPPQNPPERLAESLQADGLRPQKHLEHEKIHVQERDERDQDIRNEVHFATLRNNGSGVYRSRNVAVLRPAL